MSEQILVSKETYERLLGLQEAYLSRTRQLHECNRIVSELDKDLIKIETEKGCITKENKRLKRSRTMLQEENRQLYINITKLEERNIWERIRNKKL